MSRTCEHYDDISGGLERELKRWSSLKSVRSTKKVSANRVVGKPKVGAKWVDTNTGYVSKPEYRSKLVGREPKKWDVRAYRIVRFLLRNRRRVQFVVSRSANVAWSGQTGRCEGTENPHGPTAKVERPEEAKQAAHQEEWNVMQMAGAKKTLGQAWTGMKATPA